MRRFERDPQWRPLTEEEVAIAQKRRGIYVCEWDLSATSVYWRMTRSFGIHWTRGGKIYYDQLSAGAQDEAVDYFNQHRRSDVTLVEVELIGLENDFEAHFRKGARILTPWWKRGYGKAVLAEFDCFVFVNPEYQPIRRLVYDVHTCASSELCARTAMDGKLALSPFDEPHVNHVLLVKFDPREQRFHLEHWMNHLNTDAQNASVTEVWAALRLFVGSKFGISLPEERPNEGAGSDGGAAGMSIFSITPLVRQVQALIVDTFDVSQQAAQDYAAARVAIAEGWGSPELDWSFQIRKDLGEKLKWRSEPERDRFLQAQKQLWKAFDAFTKGRKNAPTVDDDEPPLHSFAHNPHEIWIQRPRSAFTLGGGRISFSLGGSARVTRMHQVYQFAVTDGSRPFSFLSLHEALRLGGLRPEAILGTMEGEQFSLERWRRNPLFLQFMHQVIRRAGPQDAGLRAAAQQQQNGSVYIIDLRTPDGPQGRVPPEDIVGAFEVTDGQLVPDSYTPCERYRVLTAHGFPHLPDTLHEALLSALRALRSNSEASPQPQVPQPKPKSPKSSWWKLW